MNTNNDTTGKIEVYDTTLRDGTQAEGVSLSLEDKLQIAQRLDAAGIDYIEGGYPLSNPKDTAFFAEIVSRNIKNAKVAAFGMTRRRGVAADADDGMAALLDSGAPVCTIVGKSWDMHATDVLRVTLDENLAMIADSVKFCADAGREVVYDAEHFFDGFRANQDYALSTLKAAYDSGATRLVLCDTNGGTLPDYIAAVMDHLCENLPGAKFGIHCHNDSDTATANTLAAVLHGAVHFQGTVNGIGERTGNVDICAVAANLVLKCGYNCLKDGDVSGLTDLSHYVYEMANLSPKNNQPFVGRSAFAHKGGMHVHAIQRKASSYEHIDPASVGNARRVLVSELSGASNIAAKADAKFALADDREGQKKVLNEVVRLEAEGYQFESADASFELLVRKTLGGKWYPGEFWKLDHFRCNILRANGNPATTEAVVRMAIDGKDEYTVADGDGPVNALDGALRKALLNHYSCVGNVHLMDYKVRVVNATDETAAKVRVSVQFRDEDETFGTIGVSSNIIEASWLAIVDAFEYKLLKQHDSDSK